jgi:hypothetical protein
VKGTLTVFYGNICYSFSEHSLEHSSNSIIAPARIRRLRNRPDASPPGSVVRLISSPIQKMFKPTMTHPIKKGMRRRQKRSTEAQRRPTPIVSDPPIVDKRRGKLERHKSAAPALNLQKCPDLRPLLALFSSPLSSALTAMFSPPCVMIIALELARGVCICPRPCDFMIAKSLGDGGHFTA